MVTSPGPVSYAQVLRLPGARITFALALVGRLSYGLVSLSLLLSVTTATGSYATAGAVLALFGLASSVLSPFRARLLDRRADFVRCYPRWPGDRRSCCWSSRSRSPPDPRIEW